MVLVVGYRSKNNRTRILADGEGVGKHKEFYSSINKKKFGGMYTSCFF